MLLRPEGEKGLLQDGLTDLSLGQQIYEATAIATGSDAARDNSAITSPALVNPRAVGPWRGVAL